MKMRSTRSIVRFANPFTLRGHTSSLPGGDYEVIAEERLLPGHSFKAYRSTATHLVVRSAEGQTEMWGTSLEDLEDALARDHAQTQAACDRHSAAPASKDLTAQ